jgi:hypothetical protein
MTHWAPASLFWILTGSIVALWGLVDVAWRRAARSSRRSKIREQVPKVPRADRYW